MQLYEYSWITIEKTDKRFLLFFQTHFVTIHCNSPYTASSLSLSSFIFFLWGECMPVWTSGPKKQGSSISCLAPLVICVVIFLSLAFHLRD